MNKDEMINNIAAGIGLACTSIELYWKDTQEIAKTLYILGCRKVSEDEIIIKKSEYEKIKSLYDAQKGAIMTSSIGDLPLTIEGLRTAVDEIARARNAEREAQELCEKYFNEAKDLKRELKRVEQETALEILQVLWDKRLSLCDLEFAIGVLLNNYDIELED